MKIIYLWLLPLLLFSFFAIRGGTLHALWTDEAETAFFAKTILTHGIPYGNDGVNISSISNASLLNTQLINHVSPWLQFYLTAASFQVFGISSFTARIPFILASILSVIILYGIMLRLTKNTAAAFITISLSSVCVPYILYSYQARYYGLIFFSGLLMLYASLRLLERMIWPKIIFIAASTFYVYAHYFSFAEFFIALLMGGAVYSYLNGKKVVQFMYTYILLGVLAIGLFLPWYITLKPFSVGQIGFPSFLEIIKIVPVLVYESIKRFDKISIIPIIFWPCIIIDILTKRRDKQSSANYGLLFSIFFGYLLLEFMFYFLARDPFIMPLEERYNVILIPIAILIVSLCFSNIFQRGKYGFWIILTGYILYNTLSVFSHKGLLQGFVSEQLNPYTVSDEIVAGYLNNNADDNDTVYVNYDRSHDPLIFLTKKTLKFVNRVKPDNKYIFPSALRLLPTYIYSFRSKPDWIILYSTYTKNIFKRDDFDLRDLNASGIMVDLKKEYKEIIFPVYYASDITRPEIGWHKFNSGAPTFDEQVFIYQKIK